MRTCSLTGTGMWGTPHRPSGHSSHSSLTPHPANHQFKKRAYNEDAYEEELTSSQKQSELKQRVATRVKMITFYRQQAQRRERRHAERVRELRAQKARQVESTKQLVGSLRERNRSLQGVQESLRNSLSYSAINENGSADELEILNYLGK